MSTNVPCSRRQPILKYTRPGSAENGINAASNELTQVLRGGANSALLENKIKKQLAIHQMSLSREKASFIACY